MNTTSLGAWVPWTGRGSYRPTGMRARRPAATASSALLAGLPRVIRIYCVLYTL